MTGLQKQSIPASRENRGSFSARAGLEVDGTSFHPQRRLTEGLRQRRVSMHGHPELLRGSLDELGEDALGYEVGNVWAHSVHTQDQARLRVHDRLDESPLLALDEGFGQREEREPAHLYLVALLPGLSFGETERGDFRAAEGDARDQILVKRRRTLTGHVLDGDYPLVPGRVCQPVPADDVTRRVDALFDGAVELVDPCLAPFV